jgi:nucleotide-binding universal stress UspA family protein
MSTHGHGGFGRVLYGSVADQVLRRAEIPLLLVPAACEREWAAGQLLRLLVTLDGSSLAAEALGPAREFAGTVGAELTLLAVAEPSEAIYTDALVQVQSDPVQQAAEASGYLYEAAAELRASGVSSVAVRVAVGHTAATIARVAQEVGADAIVMATHGRGGLARLFLGSVASTLERTKVPLLRHRPAAVRSVVAEPASAARGA